MWGGHYCRIGIAMSKKCPNSSHVCMYRPSSHAVHQPMIARWRWFSLMFGSIPVTKKTPRLVTLQHLTHYRRISEVDLFAMSYLFP